MKFYRLSTTTDALANFSTNAASGSFTIQNGRNFTTAANVTNNGTLTVGDTSTFTVSLTHSLTNFSGTTLTGGTYNIMGQLQFSGANIVTNAATLTLGGSQAHPIFDNQNSLDGLRGLATNNAAGSFTFQQSGHTFTAASFANNGTLTVGVGSTFIATTLASFSSQTLMGGHYLISGTFKFGGADIHTNQADLTRDGPGSSIVDLSNNSALVNFTNNASGARFCVQHNATFNFPSGFSNSGTLCIGTNNTLTLSGGDTVAGGGTLQIMGGTLVALPAAGGPGMPPGLPVTINAPLDNQGTVRIMSNATLVLTAALTNYSAGTLTGGPSMFPAPSSSRTPTSRPTPRI